MRGGGGSGPGVFHENLMLTRQMFLPKRVKGHGIKKLWRELSPWGGGGGVEFEEVFLGQLQEKVLKTHF